MAKEDKTPTQNVSAMMSQGVDKAQGAMESYFQFFQNSMSAAPWAGSELNKKLMDCAQKNLATTFDFAQKLAQAKSLPDVLRIQTEFFQTQLKSLNEQAQDLGETAKKAAGEAVKK